MITKVDDGDTFSLSCWDIDYPNVRLLGVNTPDINLNTKKESCYYSESKKYMEARIWRTYKVNFYGSDLCKDPYKWCRNLVQLMDIDWAYDVWKNMILKGIAFSWTNFSVIPNEIRKSYDMAESNAYKNWRWLWGKCEIDFQDDSKIDVPVPDKMTL